MEEKLTFPGPWVGGISLLLAPPLLLAGELVGSPFSFFFPKQLSAYHAHPAQIGWAYGLFLAGVLLLWPGICLLAQRIAGSHPHWARWGGVLVILGLFGRAFDQGVNVFVFSLADSSNTGAAVRAVGQYYAHSSFLVATLGVATMVGWLVLAVGAYRSRAVPLVCAIALALPVALPIGVLKGTTWLSVVGMVGLVVALMPLGVRVLRDLPRPNRRTVAVTVPAVLAFGVVSVLLGQVG